jgi:hypothetical protein
MKTYALWLASFALVLTACGKQEPTEPQQPNDTAAPAASVVEEPAPAPTFDEAFTAHMHKHADQLDDLMFALADGDLVAAMTPAYWLSRHDSVEGIPDEWQQHVTGMREAALKVESTNDLEVARAAAEEISSHCQACHATAGVDQAGL